MAVYKNIIPALAAEGDISWACRKRDFPIYKKASRPLTASEIRNQVLESKTVQSCIGSVAASRRWSKEAVEKEANDIIAQLGHAFSLNVTCIVGAAVKEVFTKIWTGIYVDEAQIEAMRPLFTEYPVVFLPTHRTYMDFLTISFLMYHYGLPLPAIAAAMDFLGMQYVGEVLRKCGAFFIRRNGPKEDQLYWTILAEDCDHSTFRHITKKVVEFVAT